MAVQGTQPLLADPPNRACEQEEAGEAMKLKRWGGIPLWEWGCYGCDEERLEHGGEAREVVSQARTHTRKTGHSTWLHNILMWDIELKP